MTATKFKTMGLTHIALAVKDIARSVHFYHQVFGTETMYQEEGFAQIQTPGSNDIIVFEQNEHLAGNPGGILHFGFRLTDPADISKARTVVEHTGGKIKEQGEFVPGEPYLFFYDPDGYEIEIWYEREA